MPDIGDYPFRIELEGETVGGFAEVTGLEPEAEVIEYREGSSTRYVETIQPGLTKYADITLKRGTFAGDHAFYLEWKKAQSGSIRQRDETGDEVGRWSFGAAECTGWTGPGRPGDGSDVAVESLQLRVAELTPAAGEQLDADGLPPEIVGHGTQPGARSAGGRMDGGGGGGGAGELPVQQPAVTTEQRNGTPWVLIGGIVGAIILAFVIITAMSGNDTAEQAEVSAGAEPAADAEPTADATPSDAGEQPSAPEPEPEQPPAEPSTEDDSGQEVVDAEPADQAPAVIPLSTFGVQARPEPGGLWDWQTNGFISPNPDAPLEGFVALLPDDRLFVGVRPPLPAGVDGTVSIGIEVYQETVPRGGCGDAGDPRSIAFIQGQLVPLVITPDGMAACIVDYDPTTSATFYVYGPAGDRSNNLLGDWSLEFDATAPWSAATIVATDDGWILGWEDGGSESPIIGDFDGDGEDDGAVWDADTSTIIRP